MADAKNYVAVGLLTHADLEALGHGFRSAIPVVEMTGFDELLAAIDAAEDKVRVVGNKSAID